MWKEIGFGLAGAMLVGSTAVAANESINQKRIADLNATHQEQLAEKDSALAEAEASLTEARLALTQKSVALDEKTAQLAEKDSQIATKDARIAELEEELANNSSLSEEQKANYEAQITSLQNEKATLTSEKETLQSEVDTLTARVAELEELINELQSTQVTPTSATMFTISDGVVTGFSEEGQTLYDNGELTEIIFPSTYSHGEVSVEATEKTFTDFFELLYYVESNPVFPFTVNDTYQITSSEDLDAYYDELGSLDTLVVSFPPIYSVIDGTDYTIDSIGMEAFRNCTSLTSVTIGNSVTSIGTSAFYQCNSLTSVTIGNSVTSIGTSAFSCCTSLTRIVVDSNNTIYDSRNNCNAIIETSSNTLTHGCKATIIPDSVTSIGYSAFVYCTSLTSVTIPDSVTSIGTSAFYQCTSLTSVTIGNSVTSIGTSAFSGCTSLTSISIPDSVTSIGTNAFSGCTSLTSVTLLCTTPPTLNSSNVFSSSLCTVNVPYGSLEAYQSADIWKDLSVTFVELDA